MTDEEHERSPIEDHELLVETHQILDAGGADSDEDKETLREAADFFEELSGIGEEARDDLSGSDEEVDETIGKLDDAATNLRAVADDDFTDEEMAEATEATVAVGASIEDALQSMLVPSDPAA